MDIKGPFSYNGNKFRIWNKHLKDFFSSYDFIYEPFAGSAVCLYNSERGGIASDVDPIVVSLHNSLKDSNLPVRMLNCYNQYFPNGRTKEGFYKLRNDFNKTYLLEGATKNNIHQLHLLIQLCFNSLLRFSSTGFNSPYGMKDVDIERIKLHCEIVSKKSIEVLNISYKDFPLDKIDPKGIFYFDPPYAASKFQYGGWNKQDEIDLLNFIDRLNREKIPFVLSNTFSHRGEVNQELIDWSKSYTVCPIKMSYNSWAAGVPSVEREDGTIEVIITNVPGADFKPEKKEKSKKSKQIF
jgi:DNA adenine methylase Dam